MYLIALMPYLIRFSIRHFLYTVSFVHSVVFRGLGKPLKKDQRIMISVPSGIRLREATSVFPYAPMLIRSP